MKTLPLFILVFLFLFSCTQPKHDGFVINGLTDLPDGTKVYLSESKFIEQSAQFDPQVIDSAVVFNGSFTFKGKIQSGFTSVSVYKDHSDFRNFYIGNYTVTFDSRKTSLHEAVVTGSPVDGQKKEFDAIDKKFNIQLDSIEALAEETEDVNLRRSYLTAYEDIEAQQYAATADFIKLHPDYEISAFMLFFLHANMDEAKLKELYDGLRENLKDTPYARTVLSYIQKSINIQEGTAAPEIILPDSTGALVKLSDFKGKYVLIDFWATNCGPCREENINLANVYKTYKEKGFEILSVSLDIRKHNWTRGMIKDKMNWYSVWDEKTEYEKIYGISSIPSNFLVDANGIIIAKYLRGSALTKKLDELLK